MKVVPGASADGIAGWLDGALKIRVSAPPEGGKANRAVRGVVAAALSLCIRDVQIVSGLRSARKTLLITGVDANVIEAKLGGPNAGSGADRVVR